MALLKAVIDTCVFESALRSRLGASFQILATINHGQFRFGISVALYLEYESRIGMLFKSKTIQISEKAQKAILESLAFYGDEVPIYYKIRPNLKDENDNMVFECAANYHADYLVTHNVRDFQTGELAPYHFTILTPQDFLKEIIHG